MWNIFKYLNLVTRLATLWGNLTGIKAKDTATVAVFYAPAADAFFSHDAWQKFMSRLTPDQQAKMNDPETQQCFIWGMDFITE